MNIEKKNILLFSFDDCVSYWPFKKAFKEPLRTPNLDRICEQSTVFHSAYCQSPICGPSRASFMSGKAPHQTGIFDNHTFLFDVIKPEDVWSSAFKKSGYFSSSGGKIFHTNNGMLPGPIHRQLYSDRRKRFNGDMRIPKDLELKKFGGHRNGWATTNPKDDKTFYDHEAADSAISFINSYEGDAPFYREVGFFSPHGPHVTPARFKEQYDVENFEPPEEWLSGFDENEYASSIISQNKALEKGDVDWWRRSVRNYFSALSHGDYHLGRIWDALQASPHAKNTIVIILADHGFHLGDRNLFCKTTLWEIVARVPLIIYDPTRTTPRDVEAPVSLLDVGPTVLDLADISAEPYDLAGQSLRPYLDGNGDPDRVIPTFLNDSVAIRKGDYRLIRYEDGSTQFYNIKDDVWQQRNLGQSHPAFQDMYQSLVESSRNHGLNLV